MLRELEEFRSRPIRDAAFGKQQDAPFLLILTKGKSTPCSWASLTWEMMHKAWSGVEEVINGLFLEVTRHILNSHWPNNRRFWHELRVSGLYLQFDLTDINEMMHKACVIYVSYNRWPIGFMGHLPKFKVAWAEKTMIWLRFEGFQTMNPMWINW